MTIHEFGKEKSLMRASELNIDPNKHVLYSPEMEKVIREKLSRRYDSGGVNKVSGSVFPVFSEISRSSQCKQTTAFKASAPQL